MKPSWDDAPEWANWLAMDEDGTWYWFENKPYATNFGSWYVNGGMYEEVYCTSRWKESLEQRK